MKKIIYLIIVMSLFLVSCNKSEKAVKIDDELLNKFPRDAQAILKNANPDLVTIDYLVENADNYAVEFDTDRNDFFVVLKGTVTEITTTDYSKEDLSILENDDAIEIMKNTLYFDYRIDDSETTIGKSISIGEDEPKIKLEKEYYFFIIVTEIVDKYNFSIVNYFNLN